MRSIFIDPGLSGTGYAVFINDRFKTASSIYTTVRPFENAALDIAKKLYHIIKIYDVKEAIIEFPVFYPSGKGYVSAASGSLMKLAYASGVFQGYFRRRVRSYAVPVRDYKGQIPKHVAKKRVGVLLGDKVNLITSKATHAWDAVYLGLWWASPKSDIWKMEHK